MPEERFGIHPTPGALLLGGAFLVQFAILIVAWQGRFLGYIGALMLAIAWFTAALLDHAGDLAAEDFREGPPSDAMIIGILGTSALLAAVSAFALRRRARTVSA